MPKDLPGFYYDAEKNRYFPIKGRIPGSSSSSSSKPRIPEPPKAVQSCSNSRVRISKLLQIRELYGNVISSSKGKYNFAEEFQKRQASRPKIWRYYGSRMDGETALERVPANVQMEDGVTYTEVLLTGGKLGILSITAVGKNPQDVDNEAQCLQSACVWPVAGKDNPTRSIFSSGFLWRNKIASISLPSRISCIKRFRTSSASTVGAGDNIQHALITTLGSENSGGSIYVLDLNESIMDSRDPPDYFATHRIKRVASLDCTVWTGDCGPNRNKAVIGTNLGAALVDLESGTQTWVLRSGSDVLAQQFICSGNAIICGLRNGAIVTVDPREKIDQSIHSRHTRLARHKISYSPINKANKPWFKISGDIQSSRTITFPSSISSLAALQFDDQYFLASSMDGSVKLYDHRLIKRGHVQSYDGHVNSHSHIQLGIDPSEKLVLSGGEDNYLRLWSIKSGELIFQEKFTDSILSTVSWRGERSEYSGEDSCGTGAWLGSEAGLFYTQFS